MDGFIEFEPGALEVPDPVMDLSCRIHRAHDDQIDRTISKDAKHFFGLFHNPLAKKSVCGNGDGSKLPQIQIQKAADKIHQVFSQEGFPARNVQFSQIAEDRGREEFEPFLHREVLHAWRDFPDIAHDAFCDAAVGDLEAQGLRHTAFAGDLQEAVPDGVFGQRQSKPWKGSLHSFGNLKTSRGLTGEKVSRLKQPHHTPA